MPAKNIYHDAVIAALQADGWNLTADPLKIVVGTRWLYVDLGADRTVLGAERGGDQIAVEVQSFLSPSDIDDFHHAVGQYVVYRAALRGSDIERVLYLAVPDEVYTGFLSEPLGKLVIADAGIKVVVFDPVDRRITQWIS